MKIFLIIISALLLTGCAGMGMNDSFSCGVGDGLGCRSVSEVNDIVSFSNITDSEIIQSSDTEAPAVVSMLSYYEGASNDWMPERAPEKRLRIWFSPHIDIYDNYVEETVVYSVVKEAGWKF
jgi:hypothetical protein